MTADEQQTFLRGKLGCHSLVERLAAGREKHRVRRRTRCGNIVVRLEDGLALHHEPLSAAVWVIVGGTMAIMRPITQIVGMKIKRAASLGALHDGFSHDRIVHMGKGR